MARRSLAQISFFDPEFVSPGCLPKGSVAWLLARHRDEVFPEWLFCGWRGGCRRGRRAWPAVVLACMLVLRWTEEGMSRLACCRRAAADVSWRAALGLAMDSRVPTEKTLREFERFLQTRDPDRGALRIFLLNQQVVRVCLRKGVLSETRSWAMDSTLMSCYGAVRDTVYLLGGGLKKLGKLWADATRRSVDELEEGWNQTLMSAKSIKSGLDIDWRDATSRAEGISALAHAAIERVSYVRRSKGRLCSLTDPQASHGRKSKNRPFTGFKLHLLGDSHSGLLLSSSVRRRTCTMASWPSD